MSILESVIQTLNSLTLDYPISANSSNDVLIPTGVEEESLETAEKLRVFHLLPTVAKSLGPEDTRNKLLPAIEGVVLKGIENGDDEALMVIASKLSLLIEMVGGGEHAACLVRPLGRIVCSVEEIVVVQAACDSLCTIVASLPVPIVEGEVLTLIRSIYDDDLYCSSRKAGAKLLVACHQAVSQDCKTELKNRLFHLAGNEDEVPLVRAAAVEQLAEIVSVSPSAKPDLVSALPNLVTDTQRVVRAACVRPLLELSRLLTDKEIDTIFLVSVDKLAEDINRDTRRSLATNMADLQQVAVKSGRSLHAIMLRLLEDNEPEVRRVATSKLKDFCANSTLDTVTEQIVPKLREHLTMEEEERVKGQLVETVVSLMPTLKREDSLPLVQQILSFLNESNSQTKQYVFDHFSNLVGLIPPAELQTTIMPSLLRLYQDKNWRVRIGVVNSTPLLLPHLNEATVKDSILPACLQWLRDSACDIREASCVTLGAVIKTQPALADQLHKAGIFRGLAQDPNYHIRQSWLLAVQTICSTSCKSLVPQFLPQILLMANDTTPNVRICLTRALRQLKSVLDKGMLTKEVLPCLKRLATDDVDLDVKYFAQQAHDNLSSS